LFALRHHAPITAWESVVGSYALEQEAHDLSITGATWDFTSETADRFVIQGLLTQSADPSGRPVGPQVRLLLQTFAATAIDARLDGELPAGGLAITWNGQPLPIQQDIGSARFRIPEALVAAHAIGELTLSINSPAGAPPARLRQLHLALPDRRSPR
jgi:hypothetical protein